MMTLKEREKKLCIEFNVNFHITNFVRYEEALRYLLNFDVSVVPMIRILTIESILPIKESGK